jgi:hypothetical protein
MVCKLVVVKILVLQAFFTVEFVSAFFLLFLDNFICYGIKIFFFLVVCILLYTPSYLQDIPIVL